MRSPWFAVSAGVSVRDRRVPTQFSRSEPPLLSSSLCESRTVEALVWLKFKTPVRGAPSSEGPLFGLLSESSLSLDLHLRTLIPSLERSLFVLGGDAKWLNCICFLFPSSSFTFCLFASDFPFESNRGLLLTSERSFRRCASKPEKKKENKIIQPSACHAIFPYTERLRDPPISSRRYFEAYLFTGSVKSVTSSWCNKSASGCLAISFDKRN